MSHTTLADRIAQAEKLSLALVTLTERERAAHFAVLLADPYARPTFERAHRRAQADLDVAFELFEEAVSGLVRLGMGHLACQLTRTTWQRVRTAFDLASAALLAGKDSEP